MSATSQQKVTPVVYVCVLHNQLTVSQGFDLLWNYA